MKIEICQKSQEKICCLESTTIRIDGKDIKVEDFQLEMNMGGMPKITFSIYPSELEVKMSGETSEYDNGQDLL